MIKDNDDVLPKRQLALQVLVIILLNFALCMHLTHENRYLISRLYQCTFTELQGVSSLILSLGPSDQLLNKRHLNMSNRVASAMSSFTYSSA